MAQFDAWFYLDTAIHEFDLNVAFPYSLADKAMAVSYHARRLQYALNNEDYLVAELFAALEEVHDWLTRAPLDYSNGVSHMGTDEGNVIGWHEHKKLVTKLEELLERRG